MSPEEQWKEHAETVRLQFDAYVAAGFPPDTAVQFCIACLGRSNSAFAPEVSEFFAKASLQIDRDL